MKVLGLGRDLFYRCKKLLIKHGYIEQVRLRGENGKFTKGEDDKGEVHASYIQVNYMSKGRVDQSTENQDYGGDHTPENQDNGTIVLKNHNVDSRYSNALKGYDNIAPSAHSSGDTLNGNNLIDEINAWILKTDGFYQPIDQQSLTKQQWGFSKAIAEKIGRKDLLSDVLNYLHHDGVLENGFLTRMAVSKIDEALENIRLEAHIAAQ